MARTHGTPSCYRDGCRCEECRAAYTKRKRELLPQRREVARRTGFAGLKHGAGGSAYGMGCRCAECVAANRAYYRAYVARRAARLAADPAVVPHGSADTYSHWGCRCQPCTDAAYVRVHGRERRANRKAAG